MSRSVRFACVALAAVLTTAWLPDARAGAPTERGTITVDVGAGPVAAFRPVAALGAGVDGQDAGSVKQIWTAPNLAAMKSVGLGALSYRLRTELGGEAWHWNPAGSWSDPAHQRGYWTSSTTSTAPIETSYGYFLPRRGNTVDQAADKGWSRIDDGDDETFWKSNPYLDPQFTGEPAAAHPQWVSVDLAGAHDVDTIRLDWGTPFALQYRVEYWVGADSPDQVSSTTDRWEPFPNGTVEQGHGGSVVLHLAERPVRTAFVRVLMTRGSGTGPPGSADLRDSLGFALRELAVGTLAPNGSVRDLVRHRAARTQTPITVSSTDPWHRASDRDPATEQPGFDRVARSGLGAGAPIMIPVPVLYDTPQNAAAEIRYLKQRHFPLGRVELGEEPDGQLGLPEDYGALYLEWARALHRVDRRLSLGGPSMQTADDGSERTTPSAGTGELSWLGRLGRYLRARAGMHDFNFLSVEWYPFDDGCPPYAPKAAANPQLLAAAMRRWDGEGFRGIPRFITEYGYSAFETQAEVDLPGALFDADTAAEFLADGGAGAYLYGYEPQQLSRNPQCDSWGDNEILTSDDSHRIRFRAAGFTAAELLSKVWTIPGDGLHEVYRTQVRAAGGGSAPVTAYALHRPDGRWSVLMVNHDPGRRWSFDVRFALPDGRHVAWSSVELHTFGPDQYRWQAAGAAGHPQRDLPPEVSRPPARAAVSLQADSVSVLVGSVPQR